MFPGDKFMTANGRRVLIVERHQNFAIGVFEATNRVEFWHLDGSHEEPELNLMPRPSAGVRIWRALRRFGAWLWAPARRFSR